tara:strand:- start:96841 stop:97122 length:282 start_codon:yes stop_codon:yes gene_type:complete
MIKRLIRFFGAKRRLIKKLKGEILDLSLQKQHLDDSIERIIRRLEERDNEISNLKSIIVDAGSLVKSLEGDLEEQKKKFNTESILKKVRKELG